VKVARIAARLALGLVATAAGLEIGAFALVRSGLYAAPAPHRGETGFWWHQHPEFGAWHYPDMEGPHTGACYDVRYRTNSVGARDVERPRRAAGPRIVVLGDSYLEGYGIPENSRMSNELERRTGIPHLNFAMASFGPYQELLVYQQLASQFDHTAVITSFLPINDFADLDLDLAEQMGNVEYSYRPYLVGDPPDVRRMDHRENPVRHWLRLQSYAWNVVQTALMARRTARLAAHESFFYDFPEKDAKLLVYILQQLALSAGDRPVVLLLIPALPDLQRYDRSGADPLSARLAEPLRAAGIRIVNLLPLMAERDRSWSNYFLPCDFHWSHYGNRVAADLVQEALTGSVYPTPIARNGAGAPSGPP